MFRYCPFSQYHVGNVMIKTLYCIQYNIIMMLYFIHGIFERHVVNIWRQAKSFWDENSDLTALGEIPKKKFLLRWKTIAVLRNENDDGFEIKGDLMTMMLNLHRSRPPGRRQGRRRWRTRGIACGRQNCRLTRKELF